MPNTIEPTVGDLEEIPAHEYYSGKLRDAIDNLTPQMLLKTEQDLVNEIDPTPVDYDLRRSFWEHIDIARRAGKFSVPTARVYTGICTVSYFFDCVITNPWRVAWISRPIVNHTTFYEAINRAALQKIFEYVKNNTVSEKTLTQIAKIAEMSANRAYGAVAQKMQIQSKNLNIDVSGSSKDLPPTPDHQQLAQRVEALQQKLMEPKDVTPKE